MSTETLPEAHGGTSGCGGHPRMAWPWTPDPWWVPWAGFLGVFVEQSGVRRKVMGISTMEGDAWHRGHVTVRPDGDWQVRWCRGPLCQEGDRLRLMRGAWQLPTSVCHPAHLRQAIFEAVGAGGNHGYIALDDLHVSDGACPEPGESLCRGGTVDRTEGDRAPHGGTQPWGWGQSVPSIVALPWPLGTLLLP